jgi:branched-chain amino acid transport system substrate-binding protein
MAVGLGLALAVAAAATAQELVIGVIAPLTGSKAEQGMQFKEGAELAVADLNKAGGVLGRQVRVELLDDEGQPKNAVAAAQKLAANRNVIGVIGPSSTASVNALPASAPVNAPLPCRRGRAPPDSRWSASAIRGPRAPSARSGARRDLRADW